MLACLWLGGGDGLIEFIEEIFRTGRANLVAFGIAADLAIRTDDPEPFGPVFVLGRAHDQVVGRFRRV